PDPALGRRTSTLPRGGRRAPRDARAYPASRAASCQLGPQLGVRLVHVQQLDRAEIDVVNAPTKLSAPGLIDLGLVHVRIVGVEAAQTAMDHGGTILLIEGQQRLLD